MPETAAGDVLELLEASAAGSGSTLTILERSGGRETIAFAELWRRSAGVAARLRDRVEPGATVGAVLSPSIDCLAAAIGVLRSGRDLASLPQPARAMRPAEYAHQLRGLCELCGAAALLADDALAARLDEPPAALSTYASLAGAPSSRDLSHGGRLVQFTSGSTSRPKGIVLSLDRIAANVTTLAGDFDHHPGDVVCSWLPLSHDMGLIGCFLTSWAAGASLVLMAPETFVRNPSVWMRTCGEAGATHTWAPNFGVALAARAVRGIGDVSLRSLRVCVVGAEPVQAATLRAFAAAMAPLGFRERALSPGYGLAEATLGVAASRPDEDWTCRGVDAGELGAGRWRPVGSDGTEVVSVGRPLTGMQVRVEAADGEVGEILVSGPSLLDRYLGRELELVDGRWLATGDHGCRDGDDLYVVGRVDDLLLVAGRNLYARDLELVAAEHPAVRPGNCVATPRAQGGYVIVAEPRGTPAAPELGDAAAWIRRELSRRFDAAPAVVAFIAPGSLPKTPSGKIARRRTASLFEAGELEQLSRAG